MWIVPRENVGCKRGETEMKVSFVTWNENGSCTFSFHYLVDPDESVGLEMERVNQVWD